MPLEIRIAENRIWARRLNLGLGVSWSCGRLFDGCRLELGGGHGWELREAFYQRLDGSLGKGHLHGAPLVDLNEKRQSGFYHIYCNDRKWIVKPHPTSQGGLEIKYLLQGGMSGNESLLAVPTRPLCTSLAWRSVLSLVDLWSCPFPHLHVGH